MSSVEDRALGRAGGRGVRGPADGNGSWQKPSLAYYVTLATVLGLFVFAMLAGEPQSERDRGHFRQTWSSQDAAQEPPVYDGRGKWGGYAD